MSNLLAKLGFVSQKPKMVDSRPEEKKKEDNVIRDKRISLQAKWAKESALLYHEIIPTEILESLLEHHDYRCVQWGGRRFARLVNWCSNCLDMEIHNEDGAFQEEDRKHVLSLMVWISLLFPLPIKTHMKIKDSRAHWEGVLRKILLKGKRKLRVEEFDLIMEAVFEGSSTLPGNPILDVFHDAVRFEESQYLTPVPVEQMRTSLGKNSAFRVKAHKEVRANLTPHWLFEFQKLKGLDGKLVDVDKAKKDEDYNSKDAIS